MARIVDGPLVVTLKAKVPWWCDAYIGALKFFQGMGVLEVDPEVAGAFVARHIKVYVRCGNRWKRV